MHQPLRPYSLVPSGFIVVTAVHDTASTTITVRSSKDFGDLPILRYRLAPRSQPLSSARRRPAALWKERQALGRSAPVSLRRRVVRGRQIFAERFADDAVAPWARRTARLDAIVHHLGFALGGRPAAGFARRLMLPVSKDTLASRGAPATPGCPASGCNVIGIDDWAWRRITATAASSAISNGARVDAASRPRTGHGRGLAGTPSGDYRHRARPRRRIWPSSDQSGTAGGAGRRSLAPDGERQRGLSRSGARVDASDPVGYWRTTIDPALLTAAERLQYEGYLRREETNGAFSPWPKTARRSRRSFARPGTAATGARISSRRARRRVPHRQRSSRRISPGSMPNGHPAAAMAPSCGGVFKRQGFRGSSGCRRMGHASPPRRKGGRREAPARAASPDDHPFADDRA